MWKRWLHLKLFTRQTHFCKMWLRSFAFVDSPSIFLTINSCRPSWVTCTNFFQNQWGNFPHALSLKQGPSIFLAFLTHLTHYLTAVKKLKNLSTGKFSSERPQWAVQWLCRCVINLCVFLYGPLQNKFEYLYFVWLRFHYNLALFDEANFSLTILETRLSVFVQLITDCVVLG